MRRSLRISSSLFAGLTFLSMGGCAELKGSGADEALATSGGVLNRSQQVRREARIFASTCAHCHVGHSGGIPRAGVAEDWNGRETQDFDMLVQHAIEGYRDMPPLGTCSYCSRAEIAAMTALLVAGSEIVVPALAEVGAD